MNFNRNVVKIVTSVLLMVSLPAGAQVLGGGLGGAGSSGRHAWRGSHRWRRHGCGQRRHGCLWRFRHRARSRTARWRQDSRARGRCCRHDALACRIHARRRRCDDAHRAFGRRQREPAHRGLRGAREQFGRAEQRLGCAQQRGADERPAARWRTPERLGRSWHGTARDGAHGCRRKRGRLGRERRSLGPVGQRPEPGWRLVEKGRAGEVTQARATNAGADRTVRPALANPVVWPRVQRRRPRSKSRSATNASGCRDAARGRCRGPPASGGA